MQKRKKKSSKKKLWEIFSRFIRKRDEGKCFTCGLQKDWKEMQAGHMIPRASGGLDLYFDELNVHCQCYRCNINLGGNGAIYAQRFKQIYGEAELEDMIRRSKQRIRKITEQEYVELIEIYKEKFEDLDD